MAPDLAEAGYRIVPHVLSKSECAELRTDFDRLNAGPGTRTVLQTPWGQRLPNDPRIASILAEESIEPWHAVRGIAFDKTPESNWVLGWHQDKKIAVEARHEVAGFGSWSEKEGMVHCQPPVEFLAEMLAIRLHLDDCNGSNGALRVVPGSHRYGLLDLDSVSRMVEAGPTITTELAAGDALVMRSLLLHASSKSTSDAHRRVIHLEFCSRTLPDPLRWVDWAGRSFNPP